MLQCVMPKEYHIVLGNLFKPLDNQSYNIIKVAKIEKGFNNTNKISLIQEIAIELSMKLHAVFTDKDLYTYLLL